MTMKKINFFYLVILLFISFACNDDAFLTMPELEITDCQTIYEELNDIRVDKIGKARYKYAMIDGEERLVEIVDSASYTTSYFDYQNSQLVASRGFDRLQEATNSYSDYSYSNGQIERINSYFYWQKEGETEGLNELSSYSIFSRNEKGQVIESKHYEIKDGQEVLYSIREFEWDDCNLIKLRLLDKNKTLGYTSIFFYDDKVNPIGLTGVAKTYAYFSTNNKLRTETVVTNAPNFLLDLSIDSEISESTYTYNELGLPTQRRFNEFDKVDYYYRVD